MFKKHTCPYFPADTKIIIHGKNDRRHRSAEGVHTQILDRKFQKLAFRSHEFQKRHGQMKENRSISTPAATIIRQAQVK